MRIWKKIRYIIYIGSLFFLCSCKTCDCPAYSQADSDKQRSPDGKAVFIASVMRWQGNEKRLLKLVFLLAHHHRQVLSQNIQLPEDVVCPKVTGQRTSGHHMAFYLFDPCFASHSKQVLIGLAHRKIRWSNVACKVRAIGWHPYHNAADIASSFRIN